LVPPIYRPQPNITSAWDWSVLFWPVKSGHMPKRYNLHGTFLEGHKLRAHKMRTCAMMKSCDIPVQVRVPAQG
jgi:hypothetical protein